MKDDSGDLFCLHVDVRRSSVAAYLDLMEQHGDSLAWKIVPNQRGRGNAVLYGPNAQRITTFYVYLVTRADSSKPTKLKSL